MSYTNETEPKERRAYREKCKHLSEYEDICYLRPQPHKWYIKKGHWYMCIVDKPEYGWTKGKVYQSPEDNRIETNYKGSLTNWPDSEPWFRPATRSEIPDNQLHWKPSEEQMRALKNARYMMNQSGDYYDTTSIIDSLISDLQKLL